MEPKETYMQRRIRIMILGDKNADYHGPGERGIYASDIGRLNMPVIAQELPIYNRPEIRKPRPLPASVLYSIKKD